VILYKRLSMDNRIRIAIAQMDPTVGDIAGNRDRIVEYVRMARDLGSDIVSFPELALTGYPPEDLILKKKFVGDNLDALAQAAKSVDNIIAVIGFVDAFKGDNYNAAAVISSRSVKGVYRKMLLPNYGVFDENRYFKPGNKAAVFRFGGLVFGVNICEDIWHESGPTRAQASSGARLIINISSSPYHAGKIDEREEIIRRQARDNRVAIVYTNLVGGQDELVFDGQSFAVDAKGKLLYRADAFKEGLFVVDLDIPETGRSRGKEIVVITDKSFAQNKPPIPKRGYSPLKPTASVYNALVLGLKDYVRKNGFEKVVIGLSGGIDSSIVAALAVDGLGKENVVGVYMPSRYSSKESEADAGKLASNLGMKLMTIPIDGIFKLYLIELESAFAGRQKDIAEENLQARIRGNILMALSNKFGWLVLATSNKSETSTGYATLYGDMAGGLAVVKDVPKTLVYKLAEYRNAIGPVIPLSVFTKAPTAELKYNQKDQDTLPPYEILDPILKAYVEEDRDLSDMVSSGINKDTALKVLRMVDRTEYKRRQSPPGIKITPKAFGRDRRMPITNRYR